MADRDTPIRRKPVGSAPAPPLDPNFAKDLTLQFRRVLSTKRINALNSRPASQRTSSPAPQDFFTNTRSPPPPTPRHGYDYTAMPPQQPSRQAPTIPGQSLQPMQAPALPPPPSYSSLRNLPLVPTAPTDNKSMRFRAMLLSLSNTPCRWENPGLLDEALRVVPLETIYNQAQEESDVYLAEAASLGDNTKPAWGYQDCVVKALMCWFKRSFFEWVNNPKCSTCHAPTIAQGMAAPLPDESARGANRVELYRCSNQYCQSYERFPRYNDAFVLLQTRKGRVGEWANCFSMLCRAIGSRVRWVWNSEDHVWTEVYSVHRKRWVHVDVCEGAWDQPLLYTQGWGKKLAYCIAFSADSCADVTRRYVRNPTKQALPRTKTSEAVLLHIVNEIRAMRRKDMDKKEKFRLEGEDMSEDRDFRKAVIETLARDISRILPGGDGGDDGRRRDGRPDPDAQKAAEGRQSGSTEWVRARGEGGRSSPQHPRDQRQQ